MRVFSKKELAYLERLKERNAQLIRGKDLTEASERELFYQCARALLHLIPSVTKLFGLSLMMIQFFYGNLDKLNHEYLHWILDNFVSVEASVKLDNVMSFGRFNFE